MKTALHPLPSAYLEAIADAFFGPHAGTAPADQALFIPKLAVFTAAVGVHLIAHAGAGFVRRIRNHFDPPPPPAPPQPSPSLRGIPSPDDLAVLWNLVPRSLLIRLRIGSRLADLEPTLDNTFVFKDRHGQQHRIVARNPGLKGWLRENTPSIAYSTAMHYKKLATRLRQLAGLSPRIPLEWLLPGDDEGRARLEKLSADEQKAISSARQKLLALLADNSKYSHLVQAVERELGIMRLSTVRYIQPPKTARGRHSPRARKRMEREAFSLISRLRPGAPPLQNGTVPRSPQTISLEGKTITLDSIRTAAFWDAVRRILGETNPDPATIRLQHDIQHWLAAPLPARLNRRR